MLTYSFENKGTASLYEFLYQQIRNDILEGTLSPEEKLPSVRVFAQKLNVSTVTVENAYQQLVAEGYIYSKPKSGFYVAPVSNEKVVSHKRQMLPIVSEKPKEQVYFADFISNSTAKDNFPFTTWTKMMRETMSDDAELLMVRSPSIGVWELRIAIAKYLFHFCGMHVNSDQIVVGAGTEYLYSLLIQLLGRENIYAVEDPGYQKITKIYGANQVVCVPIALDENGVSMEMLQEKQANVLHISPSHHFPTGRVTSISRRYELLAWAAQQSNRFIIEDDYDSEFRLLGKPIPSLQSIDVLGKVIYMNTFSKSLTSTIRISYMVLPKPLMERYQKELNFYSCTVSNFEQYTLARFIEKGYFEKHINRMRNYYRTQRDAMISCIKRHPQAKRVEIKEEHAGLHFLLHVDTKLSDEELVKRAANNGIHISCLSQYYSQKQQLPQHTVIINYSGIEPSKIEEAIERLFQCFWERI